MVQAQPLAGPPGPGRTRVRVRRRLRVGRVLVVAAAMVVLAVAGVTAEALVNLPSVGAMPAPAAGRSVIYDSSGKAITAVGGGINLQPVALSAVSPYVQHAFVAAEDRGFYQDSGFNIRGLLRAAWADLRGRPLQGGSTITEQLAKNLYLSPADTIERKIREFVLGLELAQRYSKAQILQQYLNVIYLGDGDYGVQAASKDYFGHPASQDTLAQAALLAGINPAPSAYDPRTNPKVAIARRNVVLGQMAQQGYITAAQAAAAQAQPLNLAARPPTVSAANNYPDPWFVDAVVEQLQSVYHLTPQQVVDGGLRIYTTLNPTVQAAANKAVAGMSSYGPAFAMTAKPLMQTGEAVVNPANGDVLALVGGRTHSTALAYDRATQAERQPGSSIKPFVDYTPALLDGLTPGTVVDDTLHTYNIPGSGPYTPTDDGPPYYGLTTLDEALRRSVNTIAVQVLNRIGVHNGVAIAQRMGLPLTAKDEHLSVALGGTVDCCTPLNMAEAYATIANGGYRVQPRMITRVLAPDGSVVVNNPVRKVRVIPANVAYVMTKMLETVTEPQPNVGWDVLSGPNDSNWATGYDATVHDKVPGWPTAGKSGTTNANKDAWFVEYTPVMVAATWVGYDQPRRFNGLYGGVYAGPIDRNTIAASLAGQKPVHFPRPAGVVQAPIDIKAAPWTVALPGPYTPAQDIRTEWFVAGTQPTQPSTNWLSCGPHGPVYLKRTHDGAAWAQKMAVLAHKSNWRNLIPLDMGLTGSCGPGGPSSSPSVPATSSLLPGPSGAATASATVSPGSPTASATVTPASPTASATPGTAPTPGCSPASGGGTVCQVVVATGSPIRPAVLPVTAGQPITLLVTSLAGAHRIVIPSLNVDVAVAPGQTTLITLSIQKPGDYPVDDVGPSSSSAAVLVAAGGPAP